MAWWKDARSAVAAVFLAGAGLVASTSSADEAADKKAAAEAYERGARAYGQGSYSIAAAEFKRADELGPTSAALEMALKAAIQAEDPVLSMTLVERSAARPSTAELTTQVARARDRFADKVGRLTIVCPAPCIAKVGSEPAQTGTSSYYRAGNYVIEITNGGAAELFAVQVSPGSNTEWKPPSKAPPPVETASPSAPLTAVVGTPLGSVAPAAPSSAPSAGAQTGPLAPRSTGLSPAWFGVSTGLTAVAAGLAVGFGVDTLGKHDAFVAHRTEAGAAVGRDAELRTNVFLGVTAAAALATALVGYFTFRSTAKNEARPSRLAPQTAWSPVALPSHEQRLAR